MLLNIGEGTEKNMKRLKLIFSPLSINVIAKEEGNSKFNVLIQQILNVFLIHSREE